MRLIAFSIFIHLYLFSAAQNSLVPERPAVLGISCVIFKVSDTEKVKEYYSEVLGFSNVNSFEKDNKTCLSFIVNERQSLLFIKNSEIPEEENNRFAGYRLETTNLEAMASYLKYNKVPVEEGITDLYGHPLIRIKMHDDYFLEFTESSDDLYSGTNKGKKVKSTSLSKRIHHVGIYVSDIEKANEMYEKILGFSETWRYNESLEKKPNFVYLRMPDCVENIEYNLTNNDNSAHACFLVEDMQDHVYRLWKRDKRGKLSKPVIGKGKRWLLNTKDYNGIRVEFTERYTVK